MLKKKVEDICNRQVEREAYSSNLYLAMAIWAETNGFAGVAGWLYVQADEERMHMLKFIKYINERGGKAVIPALKKPVAEYKNVEDVFKEVLKHEEFVTASINEIVALTLDEKDFNTHNFLQWFVMEQVEEEASVKNILDKVRLVGKNNLYQFDRDILGLRAPSTGPQPQA
ncbi:MAG: ferritin [Bacteroidetes bacterium GWE2_41_25]|nr:MAG: ferritin [Bacteroidetes bacterium GWA2_40_15]OFX92199.1 MAG: ferritin [Bacteroidetes bacterium GWC2_40_22]OFY02008.1 MAG: ferritin [Bacteroidetes bacterium GWE2_41_25]OFY58433.1 MAG: ferritin [Bacteroidetes bacterium GWF2_41_9]HAM10199.1 ferritin [Bacteroidales bacterium]